MDQYVETEMNVHSTKEEKINHEMIYELQLCHLYPDLLNLYGDYGNILAFKHRAKQFGIRLTVVNARVGDVVDPFASDLFFMGGGQDAQQTVLRADLKEKKEQAIKTAVLEHKIFLCICGGYQLMGHRFVTAKGIEIKGLGLLDIETHGKEKRLIGDTCYKTTLFDPIDESKTYLFGFENHSGRTYLGAGVKPLATVICGYGNNGTDKTEGAIYKQVYGTYSHGSFLPKNPTMTDYLLHQALSNKYGKMVANTVISLNHTDQSLEETARSIEFKRLLKRAMPSNRG